MSGSTSREQLKATLRELDKQRDELEKRKALTDLDDPENFLKVFSPEIHLYPHTKLLVGAAEAVVRGETRRLLVSICPRAGKSSIFSKFLPAYIMHQKPGAGVLIASHNKALAEGFSAEVRDRISSLPDLGMTISESTRAKGLWAVRNSDGVESQLRAVGVGAGLLGFGADVGIVDDPFGHVGDVDTPGKRDKVDEWFRAVLSTRLTRGDNAIIVIGQRLHHDDLIGRLSKRGGWDEIVLPSLSLGEEEDPLGRPEGEALCPEIYTKEDLLQVSEDMGPRLFGALHQQTPMSDEGALFDPDDYTFYDFKDGEYIFNGSSFELSDAKQLFISADTASSTSKHADYTVACVCAETVDGELLVVDMFRGKCKPKQVTEEIAKLCERYGAGKVVIENAPVAAAVIDSLRELGYSVVAKNHRATKEVRSGRLQALSSSGKLIVPKPSVFTWSVIMTREITSFPKGRNDDIVDSLAQAASFCGKSTSKGEILNRPGTRRIVR